jgi:protein TonB
MIAVTAPLSLSASRRVWIALLLSMAVHATVLSAWHLRVFTPPQLAEMQPIDVTLVAESTPRVLRRAPRQAPAENTAPAPLPRPAEPAESASPVPTSTATAADPSVEAQPDLIPLSNPKPPYPLMALRNRIEGTVLLSVHVPSYSTVGEVKVKQTSGSGMLDGSAIETVQRRWRFHPAPVDRTKDLQIVFRLEKVVDRHVVAR